jgi:ParB family chromosome partitioning protein
MASEGPLHLSLSAIRLRESAARERSNPNATIRLSESIKKYGILQPLTVRPATDKLGLPCYELVDGRRRYHAAALLGLDKLPCIVLQADSRASVQLSVIESLRQSNPHFLDVAVAFRTLTDDYRMTQEEIADRMSLSQSAVANKLRLLRLSGEEQRVIRLNGLTERHARALLRLPSAAARAGALSEIAAQKLNVAATEQLVDRLLRKGESAPFAPKPEPPIAVGPSAAPHAASLAFYGSRSVPAKLPPFERQAEVDFEQERSGEQGREVQPSKFILRDLRPLYTSIERTLAIFRKTGNDAECTRREDAEGVSILIRIPK